MLVFSTPCTRPDASRDGYLRHLTYSVLSVVCALRTIYYSLRQVLLPWLPGLIGCCSTGARPVISVGGSRGFGSIQ